MLGAVIGDIVGSRYEHRNHKSKDFPFFSVFCRMTDDSYMTLAVADALLNARPDRSDLGQQAILSMQKLGRRHPDCGFGGHFYQWLMTSDPVPYGSWGNGAAMRISPCGWAASSIEEVKALSRAVTEISHSHREGLKGAEAAAMAVYLAKAGKSKAEIRNFTEDNYYPLNFTLDEIRQNYRFDVSCQGSVPQAIEAFLESSGFEDAVRNAVSIGGDSDTIAAITGGIAEAFYGIPPEIAQEALTYFEDPLSLEILNQFRRQYIRL